MLRALILLLLVPGQALAGPWLRDVGRGFLSYSVTLEDVEKSGETNSYGAVYAEYGVRRNLTLGLDLGAGEQGYSKAIAFAVLPLTPQTQDTRISAEFGLGTVQDNAIIRPGIAIGRSFEFLDRFGWMSIETRAEIGIQSGDVALSTDLTLGYNTGLRSKWMMQLQHGGTMADPDYMRLVPSVVIKTHPGRHLEFGVTAGVWNTTALGVKLGIWQEF